MSNSVGGAGAGNIASMLRSGGDEDRAMFQLLGKNVSDAQKEANTILANKDAKPEDIAAAKDRVERAKDAFSVFLAMKNIVQSIIKDIIDSFKRVAG